MDITSRLSQALNVTQSQVKATVILLDGGATVPFIARYRKEMTGSLDDTQLRNLETRLNYLRELETRRKTILDSIEAQKKLTPKLEQAIKQVETKTLLEDLYLPYKPKRRTKAQIAKEADLESLLNALLADRNLMPEIVAKKYLNTAHNINDPVIALEGAKQILMERISEDAPLLNQLREQVWEQGILQAKVVKDKENEATKFKDYFDYQEAINKIPSHRALALFRGRDEKVLTLNLNPGVDEKLSHNYYIQRIILKLEANNDSSVNQWLQTVARFAWKVKLFTRIDLDLKLRLRELAEVEAIRVFANNLSDLLLSPPAGAKVTLGLDPGIRTGVKIAVVDTTGKLIDTDIIYPHPPKRQWDESIETLAKLIEKNTIELISIGNGTGSRETDQLVIDLAKRYPKLIFNKIMVSEAGASVYSASELAAKEFPDLDVSIRGAVSIARRLQDPLAELVKIEAKAIGVGQYQHDVNQVQLARMLDTVVEDCVNAVGVDVNTASAPLLKQVSGLSASISQNIVNYRDEHGAFTHRKQLKKVARLGDKAYQQAAGFLRIIGGDNPLDASSVHPEAYPIVNAILEKNAKPIQEIIGQSQFLQQLNPRDYITEKFGLPTINDILLELDKPGRDPRPEFKSAKFKEGVEKITDLKEGMLLEGVITNVANFGAFVDIGVHQDGLIHISQLANKFVKDPRDIVKTGETVKVKVITVDMVRKRIALSMKNF